MQRAAPQFPQVKQLQPFACKTAIIKTKDEVLGVVLKGMDEKPTAPRPMRQNLVAGKFISFPDSAASNDVLLSRKVADKLRLKVGDKALFYFIQNPPRMRQFRVSGIYQTGLDEFDEVYVIGDIRQIRELNAWPDSLVGGLEVVLKDFNRLDPVADNLYENAALRPQTRQDYRPVRPALRLAAAAQPQRGHLPDSHHFRGHVQHGGHHFHHDSGAHQHDWGAEGAGATDNQIRQHVFFPGPVA